MTDLHSTAIELHQQGIHPLPVRADGTKRPAISGWPEATPTREDIDHWFATVEGPGRPRHQALGILTGARSGNIELLEIEGEYADQVGELAPTATDSGLCELWARVSTGWLQRSPSGGLHWIYRVDGDPVPGNTKLAQDEAHYVNGRRTYPTIAETRGTGGYFVAAPTGGTAHQSGRPWELVAGGPATMATITTEEREALHALFGTLDRREAQQAAEQPGELTGTLAAAEQQSGPGPAAGGGTSPGDDYEQRTTWAEILEPAGWTHVFTRGNTKYWRRPGKSIGFSATTGHAQDRDRLWVFTTSTELPAEEPTTKFGAYALLHHGGDHSAAATQLRKDGYGEQPTAPALQPDPQQQAAATGTDGPLPFPATDNSDAPEQDAGKHLQLVPDDGLDMTDDSNARALVAEYGELLRYQVDFGRWYTWAGYMWAEQPQHGGEARELAKRLARRLPDTGAEPAKLLKHKRYSLSDRGLNALLNTARTDPAISVTTDELDAYPWELNTPTGIVDLHTGELHPTDPAKLHTRSTVCAPDPDADQGPWLQFLAQTFPDPDVREYVQRLTGYSAIGEVREHILPFAHGGGGNGKGVFLETVKYVLGSYAGKAPANFLMNTGQNEHTTSVADLAGRRFVITSEVNQRDRFDEQKVKELTGGDTVTARRMRQDFFEFHPTHHLWLMGNDKPAVESGGDAFWRRLRLIPFTHKLPEEEQDEDLPKRLRNEHAPAILQWVIEGAVRYAAQGLRDEPESIREETEKYAASSDTVGQFLADECYTGPAYEDYSTRVIDVRAAYERWCHQNGETALGGRRLTTHLARHGIKTGRDAPRAAGGARCYGGLLLRHPTGFEEDHTLDRFKDN